MFYFQIQKQESINKSNVIDRNKENLQDGEEMLDRIKEL